MSQCHHPTLELGPRRRLFDLLNRSTITPQKFSAKFISRGITASVTEFAYSTAGY